MGRQLAQQVELQLRRQLGSQRGQVSSISGSFLKNERQRFATQINQVRAAILHLGRRRAGALGRPRSICWPGGRAQYRLFERSDN